jgi:hypothetical protein
VLIQKPSGMSEGMSISGIEIEEKAWSANLSVWLS